MGTGPPACSGRRPDDGFECLEFTFEALDRPRRASGSEGGHLATRRRLGRLNTVVDRRLDFLAQLEGFFDSETPTGDKTRRDRLGLLSCATREIAQRRSRRLGGRESRSGREPQQRLHEACGDRLGAASDEVDEGLGEDAHGRVASARMLDDANRVTVHDEAHDVSEGHVATVGRVVELAVGVPGDDALHCVGRDDNASRYIASSPLKKAPGRSSGRYPQGVVNVVLIHPDEVSSRGEARLDDARGRHIARVLGVLPGDTIRIGLVDGAFGQGRVLAVEGDSVSLACAFEPSPPPRPRVDLLLALPRPKVLRRLWAQLAALGVGRLILTNAEKVERHYFDTHYLDPERYRTLLIEGLQQARDTRIPLVSIERRLKPFVEDNLDEVAGGALRLLADPSGDTGIGEAIRHRSTGKEARVLLAIGPEGGWNDFERGLFEAHGFARVGMGPRTLRTDTACVALLALAHAALRESVALKEAVGVFGGSP